MSAIFSDDGVYRYRLDRAVQDAGPVYAYFGVNGSTAGVHNEDQTTRKWNAFTRLFGGSRYIVGNPFAYCATDVQMLRYAADPIGPDNQRHLTEIITEADVLVPCWGSRYKVPAELHIHFDRLKDALFDTHKPVRIFGLTQSGDPKHPLMLGYSTELVDWL